MANYRGAQPLNQNALKKPEHRAHQQLIMRCTLDDKEAWSKAAKKAKKSLSAWIKDTLNEKLNRDLV